MSEKRDREFKIAWVNLIYAYGRIARVVNQRMRRANCVGLEVYDLLLVLETAPDGAMDMTSLGERLLVSLSGVSRLVARLQEKGLVVIERSDRDQRCKLVKISELGLAERERAWEVYSSVIQQEFDPRMTTDEAKALARLLSKLR